MSRNSRTHSRTFYKSEEVDVEFDVSDVCEFISSYASDSDLVEIESELLEALQKNSIKPSATTSGLVGSLEDEMKMELLTLAFNKYRLHELEEKLGTKFDY